MKTRLLYTTRKPRLRKGCIAENNKKIPNYNLLFLTSKHNSELHEYVFFCLNITSRPNTHVSYLKSLIWRNKNSNLGNTKTSSCNRLRLNKIKDFYFTKLTTLLSWYPYLLRLSPTVLERQLVMVSFSLIVMKPLSVGLQLKSATIVFISQSSDHSFQIFRKSEKQHETYHNCMNIQNIQSKKYFITFIHH